MSNISVGSVCSGIEAASVAWGDIGFNFQWFSEIAPFPSKILSTKHPHIANLGDMCEIPEKLKNGIVHAPDLICGGTPCQAFSLAGWKKGLDDNRGNLTLKFVDIIDANDEARKALGQNPSVVFWENVEGVLRDKTNAFGCLLSSLAGYDKEITVSRWPQAGIIRGPKRNIAWRVMDAKYFGLPQQRRQLYVLAGGKDFFPEQILFEWLGNHQKNNTAAKPDALPTPLVFTKQGHSIEVFRSYTDCLYSAYGTKWNGNAAAYNGSLFVCQNHRLRRLTPLECERLMGFPDNYTDIAGASATARYQGIGNSWAVPVIKWLGMRLIDYFNKKNKSNTAFNIDLSQFSLSARHIHLDNQSIGIDLSGDAINIGDGKTAYCSEKPVNDIFGDIFDVIDVTAAEKFYITPAGCKGILRRKEERKLSMNQRLKEVLKQISSEWSSEKIELISRKQSRGRFSTPSPAKNTEEKFSYSLF